MTNPDVSEALSDRECLGWGPKFSPIATLNSERYVVEMVLPDKSWVPGWMTRRFMGGEPTYWTQPEPGAPPTLIEPEPLGWREMRGEGS